MTDITERLREHAAIHEAQVPFDNEQREWADDLRFAAAEIARLRARVAELESARGEPVAWMNPYGGTLQVRITGLEYEKYTIPLYTAPPAPTVDVNAISEHRLRCGAHAIGEELYPCADCGTMRTKAEGGTVFTVCGGCWARHYGRLTA